MKVTVISVESTEPGLLDGNTISVFKRGDHISVGTGIACWFIRWCDDHDDCAVIRMVGDDMELHQSTDDMKHIDRESFCGECGQIGCGQG